MYPHTHIKIVLEIKIRLLYPCINFSYFNLVDFHFLSVLFYLMHLCTIKKTGFTYDFTVKIRFIFQNISDRNDFFSIWGFLSSNMFTMWNNWYFFINNYFPHEKYIMDSRNLFFVFRENLLDIQIFQRFMNSTKCLIQIYIWTHVGLRS